MASSVRSIAASLCVVLVIGLCVDFMLAVPAPISASNDSIDVDNLYSEYHFEGYATFGKSNITKRGLYKRDFNGKATYYYKGMGACGLFDYERNNDNVAALNQFDYGFPTWKGPNCGRCISVYFPDIKMSKVFRVTDRCEQTGSNCYRGDVDLHFTAFPDALRRHGKVKIQWKYLSSCAQRVDSGIGFGNIKSGSSGPKPKPKPKRKPAPKRKSKSKGRNRQ